MKESKCKTKDSTKSCGSEQGQTKPSTDKPHDKGCGCGCGTKK